MWERIGCCKTLAFQGLVHQSRSLEEDIAFIFKCPHLFLHISLRRPLEATFMQGSAFPLFNHGRVSFSRAFSAGQVPLHFTLRVPIITRTRSTLCKFPEVDLLFSVSAQGCLAVRSPAGAHPALAVPRGCRCSHSGARAASHSWQIWSNAALFSVAGFTGFPGGEINAFYTAS